MADAACGPLRVANPARTGALTPRDCASMRDPASGARTYATSQSASCESSKSVGYRARAGTGGVDGRPIDSRIARIGSGSVSTAMKRSPAPQEGPSHCTCW